ncbi:hypothetical protein NL108_010468 [Boleophthalmus pectinirostris]|nr:hypothetical protein NL108_010468 [Boleophthalmus pectinirostris]
MSSPYFRYFLSLYLVPLSITPLTLTLCFIGCYAALMMFGGYNLTAAQSHTDTTRGAQRLHNHHGQSHASLNSGRSKSQPKLDKFSCSVWQPLKALSDMF